MMRLNRRAGAFEADTFDDVGVKRSLQQPLNLSLLLRARLLFLLRGGLDLSCLLLEDVDESVADDLAFLFGILDAFEPRQEER